MKEVYIIAILIMFLSVIFSVIGNRRLSNEVENLQKSNANQICNDDLSDIENKVMVNEEKNLVCHDFSRKEEIEDERENLKKEYCVDNLIKILDNNRKSRDQILARLNEDQKKYYLIQELLRIIKDHTYMQFQSELDENEKLRKKLLKRKLALRNFDKEVVAKENSISELEDKINELKVKLNETSKEYDLADVGFYEVKYDLENSNMYTQKLDQIRSEQKSLIHLEIACTCGTNWLVEDSVTKGKSMVKKNIKLMLRAFNGECDGIIANVSYRNINSMINRITSTFNAINKLGKTVNCQITEEYFKLKQEELRLVYEYKEKLYQEKEEQRIIKDQIREEERAAREFEKEKIKIEKEAKAYKKALIEARKELEKASGAKMRKYEHKILELEKKLAEAEKNKRAISQAQITKCGYIYVISNIGAFGENTYKIGMTRRLVPYDRIRELNGPAVPFKFDLHAMIFTENAPELELQIHRKLAANRVNRVNARKEFFNVTLEEIEDIVRELNVEYKEFIYVHEAREYRQTLTLIEEEEKLRSKNSKVDIYQNAI